MSIAITGYRIRPALFGPNPESRPLFQVIEFLDTPGVYYQATTNIPREFMLDVTARVIVLTLPQP